ncbi:hypothetical protein CLV24_102330 [Pontibacter ummariensis]|uniref:Uncharacterized protein n=1 Tax=Pontibacter ummariensis TaxID=1610492 RepID=A0A239BP72_9BACT|nr:hypothetical protein [Pontibacter ummariensis]PRY15706.1 hypothetical protein CLV24_102330 [Pontibacter ummariensis]SNS09676.1 hypothetical protein SAMN06296052_10282 [Pontibacter ummariensis]
MKNSSTNIQQEAYQKLQPLLLKTKLKQEQLSKAIFITKDSIISFLKRQVEQGNWQEVQEILKGKPMTEAGSFLVEELRDSVVSKLILRLGLRKFIAVGIALVLLPLLLARLSGELLFKLRKREAEA